MTDAAEPTPGFDSPLPFDTGANVAETAGATETAYQPIAVGAEILRLSPLTNNYVVGVAGAALYSPEEIAGLADITVPGSPHRAEFDARLAAVVQQANSGYFHFELTTLHGPGDPTPVTLEHGESIVSLTRDHSDRKLTVLLVTAIDGAESGTLTHPGAEIPQEFTVGSAVVFPSYVVPTVDLGEGGSLRAVITHALGPAFR